MIRIYGTLFLSLFSFFIELKATCVSPKDIYFVKYVSIQTITHITNEHLLLLKRRGYPDV
jgi:hypothetical protein